jgi:hypothetical protein
LFCLEGTDCAFFFEGDLLFSFDAFATIAERKAAVGFWLYPQVRRGGKTSPKRT